MSLPANLLRHSLGSKALGFTLGLVTSRQMAQPLGPQLSHVTVQDSSLQLQSVQNTRAHISQLCSHSNAVEQGLRLHQRGDEAELRQIVTLHSDVQPVSPTPTPA